MADAKAELRERVEQDGIEFVLAMFVDMDGKPCAKAVPAAYLDGVLEDGAGFAGFAAGRMGQSPADPDILAIPDPDSYTPLPWRPGVAILHCDPHVEGKPWPYAPRVILKRQLDRLAERGMVFNVGAEAEYSLVRRTENGGIELADPEDTADKPCYEAKALGRMWDHLSTVSRTLNDLGWGNYANDHEDGNGQFENNITYADVLTTADRVIFFRYMIHELAHAAGMTATFMPKPFSQVTGNGCHFHSSLWTTDGEPLFEDADDPRGLGLSETAYQFIAGVLEHGKGMAAIAAPTVNSYKRIAVRAPTSGSTWTLSWLMCSCRSSRSSSRWGSTSPRTGSPTTQTPSSPAVPGTCRWTRCTMSSTTSWTRPPTSANYAPGPPDGGPCCSTSPC
jgi:glutamine synthetase